MSYGMMSSHCSTNRTYRAAHGKYPAISHARGMGKILIKIYLLVIKPVKKVINISIYNIYNFINSSPVQREEVVPRKEKQHGKLFRCSYCGLVLYQIYIFSFTLSIPTL
jgi:hypothetical protein